MLARLGNPSPGQGVNHDGAVGPPGHDRRGRQVGAEHVAEHHPVQAGADSTGVDQGEVDVPEHEQAAHAATITGVPPTGREPCARQRSKVWAPGARLAADGSAGPWVPVAGRIRRGHRARTRAIPIAEVMGEYLQLRNAGGGALKGLCPFHDEKTPSFNVTPARGLWYCFGCAEGGDVIGFVEKIDNLSFPEAVERLAGRAGIELRYEQGGDVPGHEQSRAAGCSTPTSGGRVLCRTAAAHRGRARRASSCPSVGSRWPTRSGSASGTHLPSGRRSPAICGAAGSPTPSCSFPGWPARAAGARWTGSAAGWYGRSGT